MKTRSNKKWFMREVLIQQVRTNRLLEHMVSILSRIEALEYDKKDAKTITAQSLSANLAHCKQIVKNNRCNTLNCDSCLMSEECHKLTDDNIMQQIVQLAKDFIKDHSTPNHYSERGSSVSVCSFA